MPCCHELCSVKWHFHFAFCSLPAYSMVCKDCANIDYPGHGCTGHNALVLLQAFPIALIDPVEQKVFMGNWFLNQTKASCEIPAAAVGHGRTHDCPGLRKHHKLCGPRAHELDRSRTKDPSILIKDSDYLSMRVSYHVFCRRSCCPRISPLKFLRVQPTTRMDHLRKSPSAAQNFALTPALITSSASWYKCDGGQMTAHLESAHTNVFCKLLSSTYKNH